jgi:hypothetical protein
MLKRYLNETVIPQLKTPQDWNKYAYARNNPVNYRDPTGHVVECPIPGGCGRGHPYPWELPSIERVLELAEMANVPPELLGAILETVQAVDYSTTGLLTNDLLEDIVFGSLCRAAHPTFLHPPLNLPGSIQLKEALLFASLFRKHPSPGLTQLQLRRAKEMEEWLFKEVASELEYEPMREALGRSEGTTDLLFSLYNPREAVVYAAVHIRWLIEMEYGPETNASDLSVDQMAIIAAQYNIGPRSERPTADYSDNIFYQTVPLYIRAWQIRLRSAN